MDFTRYLTAVFENFRFVDALQIFLIAVVILFVYCYAIKHSSIFYAYLLFASTVLLFVCTFLCDEKSKPFFNCWLILLIVTYFFYTVVLFRNEFRRDIFKASMSKRLFLVQGENDNVLSQEEIDICIANIVKACQNMSKSDIGALIIIVKDNIYDYILESGTYIDSKVSSELLETIFFPKSPLHDGAVIIKGDRILAAGCYLPLCQEGNVPKEFGTRHRAALGITESHPTLTAVVISEETGIISAMYDKRIKRYLDGNTLTKALQISYAVQADTIKESFWGIENNEA